MFEMNPSNKIYHYCSVNSFFNIIRSKSLRLGDIEKSNDSMEKMLVIGTINRLLGESIDNYTDPVIQKTIRGTQTLLNEVNDIYSYVCCFSEDKDSLSQWRGYADEALGMAIGIDKSKIDFEINRYRFFKVSYDPNEMEDDCKRIINESLKNFHLDKVDNSKSLFINLQDHLRDIYLRYKNKAFEYEKEWRITANGGFYNQEDGDKLYVMGIDSPEDLDKNNTGNIKFSKLQHCVANNQIRSYIDLNFEDDKNDFIKEIWLGPKCNNNKNDIRILLSECGYDVEAMVKNGFQIHKSSASYR